jgi:hypothetical protein
MFDLEGGGPSSSLGPSNVAPSTGAGHSFNQGATRRGGAGVNAYEGYKGALQAKMGGKVAYVSDKEEYY